MSLNIKNERVHALAREAARVTGLNQTSAIEEALRLLLVAHGVDPRRDDAARRRDAARDAALAWRALAPGEGISEVADLYDEISGLPRR